MQRTNLSTSFILDNLMTFMLDEDIAYLDPYEIYNKWTSAKEISGIKEEDAIRCIHLILKKDKIERNNSMLKNLMEAVTNNEKR